MHVSRLVYLRIVAVALVVASCGGTGAGETTTTAAAPTTTAASTTTTESEPVLVVDELAGFEARSVVFANIEFTVTGVKVSNQGLRSYAEGGEPEIADTYHAWRGETDAGDYADVPGFCKSATLEEVAKHGFVLTPGRYVGAEAADDDDEPFEEKMTRLVAQLRQQQTEAATLDATITANLREVGYGR